MQKGFATLEIIFVVLIISVLLSAIIPNVARIIDQAALDYETKRLYSELRFLQSLNRAERTSAIGTGLSFAPTEFPVMKLFPDKKSWQILRGNKLLREEHFMRNIETVEFKLNDAENRITFSDTGHAVNMGGKALSGNIILTSRLGKKSKIIFNTVGRMRGGRVDDNDG